MVVNRSIASFLFVIMLTLQLMISLHLGGYFLPHDLNNPASSHPSIVIDQEHGLVQNTVGHRSDKGSANHEPTCPLCVFINLLTYLTPPIIVATLLALRFKKEKVLLAQASDIWNNVEYAYEARGPPSFA